VSCAHPDLRVQVSGLGAITTLTVPAGQLYIYDVASGTYSGGVSVYGTLVFEDNKALSLTSSAVTVFSGGKIVAGVYYVDSTDNNT
jgi:ketosteroid isomerase-like protein